MKIWLLSEKTDQNDLQTNRDAVYSTKKQMSYSYLYNRKLKSIVTTHEEK